VSIPCDKLTFPMNGENELSSWKEIASYLRVGVRTAQMWERERGLPVRRIPGPRGRVLANVEELEAWKNSGREPAGDPPSQGPPAQRTNRRYLAAGIAVACLIPLLLAAFTLKRYMLGPGVPASYRIDRYGLTVLDLKGAELWRAEFSRQLDLRTYEAYPGRFVWIGDLDGDGRREVLFVQNTGDPSGSTPLICYSDRGAELWRFTPGRRVRSSTEEFAPTYSIRSFVVGSLHRRRPHTIVVTSSQTMYYPDQVVLLSSRGKLLREYWHSGHLFELQVADLNGDGTDEIYLAGVSNGWKAATLVVLDPDHFGGASQEPEAPDHQLLGFERGVERARVILPRSCLSRADDPYNTIERLMAVPGEIIVETNEKLGPPIRDGIFFHFAPDLSLRQVMYSDSYQTEIRKMSAQPHPCRADDITGMHVLR
jgi:hypothetical protein